MNQEYRQKVLDYCAYQNTYPLYFFGYESTKEEFDPSKYSVEDMIKRVLTLSEEFPSFCVNTNDYECSSGRWRSAIDIWRHIIYYYPTIEIFDVMRGIYNIRKDCGGQYCNDVCRRVFAYKLGSPKNIKQSSTWRWKNHGPDSSSIRMRDEFGLYFADWEDI